MYGACVAAERGMRVVAVTPDSVPFARASHANQARLHNGYHYPRSVGTALQSVAYFDRFAEEFPECTVRSFEKIYAIAHNFSLTSPAAFRRFCLTVGIPLSERDPARWFQPGTVDAVFSCREGGFDFAKLRAQLWGRLTAHPKVEVRFNCRIESATAEADQWSVALSDGSTLRTGQVLNATYASVNQVLNLFGEQLLPIRYELCELVVGRPAPALRPYGITVMDGSFFSVMPFGSTERHSLSAVDYTPRLRCMDRLPTFRCQTERPDCSPEFVADCATCAVHPSSGVKEMLQLAGRYLRPELAFEAEASLYSIRPVLDTSSVDDSRPTLIISHRSNPTLITVLSGKVNTIFDLDSLW